MPEETMRYRVELDASDLAPQLEAIRNQIDSAIGSAAAFQSPPAGLANFQQMTNFVTGGANFGSADVVNAANSAVMQTANFIDQAADRAQLGFSRFVGDARRLGLLSSTQYPSFEPMLSSAEAQLNPGITGNLGGFMFGLGFDPRGTLSMGEFRELSAETFSRDAGNFVAGSPGALAGAALGSIMLPGVGTVAGAIAGGLVGFAADMGYNALAGRAQEQNEVARGLQGIADRTFGGMSIGAAREMAGELQDRAYSYQGRLRDFDMQDIQETILTFGNAGGFGGIQNPQEFAQRTREVLDNVRLVAHSLNVFQEEAAQIMGELQQRGVTSLAGMGNFASTQQAMGGMLGMTGMGFIQLGLQGAQMVQGAGIGAATGFNVMQQAAMGINRAQADPFTRAIVADMGGAQAATATMAENVFRQMQSGMGFMQTMNVLGGGSVFAGGPGEIFEGAANYMGADPSNYFRALSLKGVTNAAILGQTGFEGQQVQMVANAMQMMQDMGLAGDTIDDAALAGFMQLRYQIDSNTANLLVQTVAAGPETYREQQGAAWVASVQNILNEQETTGLQRLGAGIAAGLLENTIARNIRGTFGDAWTTIADVSTDFFESISDVNRRLIRIRSEGAPINNEEVFRAVKERGYGNLTARTAQLGQTSAGRDIQAAGLQGILSEMLYGRDLSDKEEDRIVQDLGDLIVDTRDRLQASGVTNVSQEMINASITADIDMMTATGESTPLGQVQAHVEEAQEAWDKKQAVLNARLAQEGERAINNSMLRAKGFGDYDMNLPELGRTSAGKYIQAAGLQGMLGDILYGQDLSDKEEDRIVQDLGNLIVDTRDRLEASGVTNVSQEMINASIIADIDIQKRYNVAEDTSFKDEFVKIFTQMAVAKVTSASEFLGDDAQLGAAGYEAMSQKVFESSFRDLKDSEARAVWEIINEDKSGDLGLPYGKDRMTALGESASFEQLQAHENVEEAQEAWDEERAAIIDRVLGEYDDKLVKKFVVGGFWGGGTNIMVSARGEAKAGTEAFMEAFEESGLTWKGFLNEQMAPEIDAATRITAQAFYRKGQGTTGIAALDLQIERVRAKAADAMSVALASDFQGIKRLEEGSEERREAIEALYGTIVSAQEDDKDVIFHKDAQYLSKATRAMFENLKTLTGADRQRALKEWAMTASRIEMTAALETGLDKESMQTLIGGFGADSDMIAKATLLGIQTLAGEIETGKGLKVFIP